MHQPDQTINLDELRRQSVLWSHGVNECSSSWKDLRGRIGKGASAALPVEFDL